MKNERGVTLLELLTVVVILSIVLGIGLMTGRNQIGKARVEEAIRQCYSEIVAVRQRAVNRSRTHFVVINEGLSRYEIWEDTDPGPDGDGNRTAADTQLSQTTTRDQLRGPATITFDNRGLASGLGTIRIESTFSPVYDCVVVSTTRIRLGRFEGGTCVS